MNAVRVHGILLAVALLVAFQTWTRDQTTSAEERAGTIKLWEESVDQISIVTYESPSRTLLLERRPIPTGEMGEGGVYLWGIAIPRARPGDSSAATLNAVREEFPVGDDGDRLMQQLAELVAMRDLGDLTDDSKEEYELSEPDRTLSIVFASGTKNLEFGGTVFGGPHRYANDPSTGRGYVISNEMIRNLEGGPATLRARALHRYGDSVVTGVTVRTPSGERQMTRTMDGPFGVWSRPDTPGAGDQTFANFMERVQQLSVLTYHSDIDTDTLGLVVRLDFVGEGESPVGFLEMYRTAPDSEGVFDYYVRTEVSRVLALAYRNFAERVDRDLADLF